MQICSFTVDAGTDENVAINDVLPLKDARRDAVANEDVGAPVHHRPNVDGFIYIHYTASPYSARFRLAKFG